MSRAHSGQGAVIPTCAEGDGERPFVVTVIAQRADRCGYRCGFVWAASEDEAIGRFMRFVQADNPGWTVSTPAALHITSENLEGARRRHSPQTPPASSVGTERSEVDKNPDNQEGET